MNNQMMNNNPNDMNNYNNMNNNYNNMNGMNNNMNIQPEKPKKKKKRNTKKILLYIFFILVIIGSGIVFYIDYNKAQEQPPEYDPLPSEIQVDDKDKEEVVVESISLNLAPDVDLTHERTYYHNDDIIGRLEIPDLINVLVVRGNDNQYYLSHSIFKEYDIRGTEFMDHRLNVNSKQINIYGHNTRDINIKVAFLKLEQFLDQSFFDNNQYIVFQHDTGKKFYRIIALKEVRQNNNEHMIVDYTGSDFVSHVQNMTTGEGVINSRVLPYDENSEIIVLQTCSHHWDNAFYTLIAVKVKEQDL